MKGLLEKAQPPKLMSAFLGIIVLLSGVVAPTVNAQADYYKNLEFPFYDPSSGGSSCDPSAQLSGSDNESKVWNFLSSQGLKPIAAAGLMGNFQSESAGTWNPRINNGGDLTDSPKSNAIAYGLAQWLGGRQDNLVQTAQQQGIIPGDLGLQLGFIKTELNSSYKTTVLDPIQALSNGTVKDQVTQAAFIVYQSYEGPNDGSYPSRESNAWDVYQKFSSNPPTSGSGGNCAASSCSASGQPVEGTSANTIVIDPGHVPGHTSDTATDPTTGLYVEDYDNPTNERIDAYNASVKIVNKLKTDGYNAINSKAGVDDSFDLGQRAAKDNAPSPALIVVLHGNNDSVRTLMYPDSGSERTPGDKINGKRLDGTRGLTHPEIESPSQAYAQQMATIINSKINDGYTAKSYTQEYGPYESNGLGGNGLNFGNTPVQAILSAHPEVYSEVDNSILGADSFANAMVDAIEQAIPLAANSGSQPSSPSNSTSTSAILCEAQKYQGIYYQSGGGHAGYSAFRQACPEAAVSNAAQSSTADNPGPCATDCSGLVSVAIDAAYNQNYNWVVTEDTGEMSGDGAQYWQKLGSIGQAQPGDIVTRLGHVEIVQGVSGNSLVTFGSHQTGTKTGPVSSTADYWTAAWRWTGPGVTQ